MTKITEKFSHECPARIGLLGNPSDAYHGQCLSLAIDNFSARVELCPAERMQILPHPAHDGLEAPTAMQLVQKIRLHGCGGGVRLLQALLQRFFKYADQHSLSLPERRSFTLKYDTTIPRASGLAGSSAIVGAALECLLDYYDMRGKIPLTARPQLILDAEEDLGITAGLQDRVAQVYGGLVYMDFDASYMQRHGHGRYEAMNADLLPPLWLLVSNDPSDSGKVHSTVRERWHAGDESLRANMAAVADLARRGRQALKQGRCQDLAELMNENFRLRCQMFGEEVIGARNIQMVSLARSVGGAAKLCGSGGAAVAYTPHGVSQAAELRTMCNEHAIEMMQVQVAESSAERW